MFNRQKSSRVVDALILSENQTITADANGTDGTDPLVADFGDNIKGDLYYLWGNIVSADFTTGDETYDLIVQSADAEDFSGDVSVEKVYRLPVAATVVLADKLQLPGLGFCPERRYGRVRFDLTGTSPELVTSILWATPAFT